MPTIDQLPAASASADSDELIVSQSGIARKVTRAQLLSGVQQDFAAATGQLLGNTSGSGTAEGIAIGGNLILAGGTLSATASPFLVYELPLGVVPGAADMVPLSQSNTNVAVPYAEFMGGLAALTTINASHFTVTPTGSTSVLKMSDFAANTLQKSGAQMQGPLLLAADPALPLQAATMEYVQNTATAAAATALPLAGGAITGPTTITLTNAGTGNVSLTPLVINLAPTSDRGPGGFQGYSSQVWVMDIYQNPDGTPSNFESEGLSAQMTVYSSASPTTVGHSATGSHVTRMPAQKADGTIVAGVTAYPALWSLYSTVGDQTGLPSSKTGALAGYELDFEINSIDDAGVFGGFTLNADNKVALSAGGGPASVQHSFMSTGLNDCWIWAGYRATGNHIMSAFDSRFITLPNTTVDVASSGTSVHVANAVPFAIGSSPITGGVTTANPILNVKIGANVYEVTGYVGDGPGKRSGTLTLSTALQGTDGAAGTAVSRAFYGLLMDVGQAIGFDDAGNIRMIYDPAVFSGAGGVHLTSGLQVDGSLQVNNTLLASGGMSASGSSTFATMVTNGPATFNDGVSVAGGFLQPPSYPHASMPNAGLASANSLIWVSDALKPGETTGAGSGVLACPNAGRSAWLRVGDYTTIAT